MSSSRKDRNVTVRTREVGVEAHERDPLLPRETPKHVEEQWTPPQGFIWIELALMSNVFLAGFDGTVTASTYAAISSHFGASSFASWITTSYLLTSTAVQPLYGRFSDIFGRRICLLLAAAAFGLGCLGCAVATDVIMLDMMRALAGVGGGGLMTMTTIINSDIVPPKHRGMYQAVQNIMIGLGAISGACLGGFIADSLGWRFCFYLQVPIAFGALFVAALSVRDVKRHDEAPPQTSELGESGQSAWKQVDLMGSFTLVSCLGLQTAALSLGSRKFDLTNAGTMFCVGGSLVMLALFIVIEAKTSARPIMPLGMLGRMDRVALLASNLGLGMVVYGLLFLMPLVFQAVLLDSASTAGFRLMPPSMMSPLGSIATGYIMAHRDWLISLTRVGLLMLLASSCLVLSLGEGSAGWKYSVYLMIGNFGQGMVFPASLFAFMRTAERADHAVATSLIYLTRSIGSIWGVAAVSTVTQAMLMSKLTELLAHVPNCHEVVKQLRRSVESIRHLPPDVQELARGAYFEACQGAMWLLVAIAALSVLASLAISHPRKYIGIST